MKQLLCCGAGHRSQYPRIGLELTRGEFSDKIEKTEYLTFEKPTKFLDMIFKTNKQKAKLKMYVVIKSVGNFI